MMNFSSRKLRTPGLSLPGGDGVWLYALEAFGLIRLEIELLLGGISMTQTRWVCRHHNYRLIRPLDLAGPTTPSSLTHFPLSPMPAKDAHTHFPSMP